MAFFSESGRVVASGWGRERGELVFNEYRVSVWEDEKVLAGRGGGDGCGMVCMYLLPLDRTLKNDVNGKFYVVFTSPPF